MKKGECQSVMWEIILILENNFVKQQIFSIHFLQIKSFEFFHRIDFTTEIIIINKLPEDSLACE